MAAESDRAPAIVAERIAFHGIVLLLTEHMPPGLPDDLVESIRQEARSQGHPEINHAATIRRLVEAFELAGLQSFLMKGTAIAYSTYVDPAIPRRGDSDIILPSGSRAEARRCLRRAGFQPNNKPRGLQEAWVFSGSGGFVHEVDIHLAMSNSPTLSAALAHSGFETRAISLPQISPWARRLGLIDNVVII